MRKGWEGFPSFNVVLPEDGEVGAFMVGNEFYIKEYEKDGLHSLHPNYPVMRFGEEESVYLIGRVLSIMDNEEIASQEDVDRFLELQAER